MTLLALTMGEPAGIGGEIALGAWRVLRETGPAFVLLDDADLFEGAPVRRVDSPEEAGAAFGSALPVLHRPLPRRPVPGKPDPANAPAVVASIDEAVALAMEDRPGLVLADIQLADGSSGIDAVNELLGSLGDIPVIFITAFPERLLTGDRPEPAFLISKPYSEEQVRSAVSQAMFFASTEGLGAAWALPSLELLMDEPERKVEVWRAMRRIMPRWKQPS